MKSKEEVIKDAWIEAIGEVKFNESKLSIDKNGWVNSKEVGFLYNEKYPFLNENFHQSLPKRMSLETQYYIRPNSLNGIDDNFGWISINSEKDFESIENGYYHWYNIENGDWEDGDIPIFGKYTHYQSIKRPLTPIY